MAKNNDKGCKMTNRIAANGASLDTIKRITDEFHAICGTSGHTPPTQDTASRLNTTLAQNVEEFSQTLKSALVKHLNGADDAVSTFESALKQRSAILSDPVIKNQGQGKLDTYLRNIVHLDDDGDVEKSLELTKELHGNALDPLYKGIEPSKPQHTERPDSPAIL